MLNNKTDYYDENINWRDEGCELFSSCLNCPLPYCIEEVARGKQKLRMLGRASQIADIKYRGKSTAEIAWIFGVSGRTVQRALAIAREENDVELQLRPLLSLIPQ